jgi:hypothetical protein
MTVTFPGGFRETVFPSQLTKPESSPATAEAVRARKKQNLFTPPPIANPKDSDSQENSDQQDDLSTGLKLSRPSALYPLPLPKYSPYLLNPHSRFGASKKKSQAALKEPKPARLAGEVLQENEGLRPYFPDFFPIQGDLK